MIPVLAADNAIAFVSGGFAAAAADSTIIASKSFETSVKSKDIVNSGTGAFASGAALAVGAVIPSFLAAVGAPLFAGSINSVAATASAVTSTFHRIYETIKRYVIGEGRPITEEEFIKALGYNELIDSLRQVLKEYVQRNNMTEHQLYSSTLDYKNISDDDKIKLAVRLTKGLL